MTDQVPQTDLTYTTICRQPYANGRWIEAGLVDGHEVDSVYLAFGDASQEYLRVLLAWDEVATMVWALGGALYSAMMNLPAGSDVNHRLRALSPLPPPE